MAGRCNPTHYNLDQLVSNRSSAAGVKCLKWKISSDVVKTRSAETKTETDSTQNETKTGTADTKTETKTEMPETKTETETANKWS
jgi:hypothetical protein